MKKLKHIYIITTLSILTLSLGLVSCAIFSNEKIEFVKEKSAPIKLEYVDFRIKKGRSYEHWSQKLGKYKFRIFGCRRDSDEIIMNSGRVFRRNMRFFQTFFEEMNDELRIVVNPNNPYYELTEKLDLPDYYLTAEVTDYYMNVCDGFDWDKTEKTNLRNGASEITITWRIIDLGKRRTYWKGQTRGFAEITDPVENGETELVEKAFADALSRLYVEEGFKQTLMTRIPEYYKTRQYAILHQTVKDYEEALKTMQENLKAQTGIIRKEQSLESKELKKVPVEIIDGKEITNQKTPTPVEDIETTKVIEITAEEINKKLEESLSQKVTREKLAEFLTQMGYTELTGKNLDEFLISLEASELTGAKLAEFIKHNSNTEISGTKLAEFLEKTKNIELTNARLDEFLKTAGSTMIAGKTTNIDEISATEIDAKEAAEELVHKGQTELSGYVKEEDKSDKWLALDGFDHKPSKTYNNETGGYSVAENSKLYINNTPPFTKLTPAKMYKIRSSVVSATNIANMLGSGLIISPQLILTSNRLITKENDSLAIKTINNREFKAKAIRKNIFKDTALVLLEEPTKFSPLPLRLDLPDMGEEVFIGLGAPTEEIGEGYLDDTGRVTGYRYSEETGAEIIVDTYVQENTLGGALIDKKGNIIGMAHSGKRTDDAEVDYFIPISTALKSMDVYIINRPYPYIIPKTLQNKINEELKNKL